MELDLDACYRAVSAKEARFDGCFVTAVTSTRIYCRPSCPAVTPKRSNVRFFRTAAAAQLAGFRACKRCRPDVTAGSPEWNVRADVTSRAIRLLNDGVVDREGVSGLAARVGYSERQLHRLLRAEVGAGPQALARARRSETARLLIETTDLRFSEIAFSSGFASIRQFNETIRLVFGATPTHLRGSRDVPSASGELTLRLAFRPPLDASALLGFLGDRAVRGIETGGRDAYRRTLRLPFASGTAELAARDDHVVCVLRLDDLRDLAPAVQRCRRLLDLDADPVSVDDVLSSDRALARAIRARPGRRIPGAVDGFEIAVRAILGQQVSVAAARTLAGRLVASFGKPLNTAHGELTHAFPSPETLAEADLESVGIARARATTIRSVARRICERDLVLDEGSDRAQVRVELESIAGIGPWTSGYIVMRGLGDPDVFLPTDLGVRKALERLGLASSPRECAKRAERWRPWRSYAVQYLWASLSDGTKEMQR